MTGNIFGLGSVLLFGTANGIRPPKEGIDGPGRYGPFTPRDKLLEQSPAIHEKRHFMIERVIQITDIMDDSGLDGPSGTGVQVLLKLN